MKKVAAVSSNNVETRQVLRGINDFVDVIGDFVWRTGDEERPPIITIEPSREGVDVVGKGVSVDGSIYEFEGNPFDYERLTEFADTYLFDNDDTIQEFDEIEEVSGKLYRLRDGSFLFDIEEITAHVYRSETGYITVDSCEHSAVVSPRVKQLTTA